MVLLSEFHFSPLCYRSFTLEHFYLIFFSLWIIYFFLFCYTLDYSNSLCGTSTTSWGRSLLFTCKLHHYWGRDWMWLYISIRAKVQPNILLKYIPSVPTYKGFWLDVLHSMTMNLKSRFIVLGCVRSSPNTLHLGRRDVASIIWKKNKWTSLIITLNV